MAFDVQSGGFHLVGQQAVGEFFFKSDFRLGVNGVAGINQLIGHAVNNIAHLFFQLGTHGDAPIQF